MAKYQAIASIGGAILKVIKTACEANGFSDVQCLLYQPSDLQNSFKEEGVYLYLYRVAMNTTQRNWPPHIEADGQRFLSPLPVDLHYLLIPWAQKAERQQLLLALSMRALEDQPTLDAGLLNSVFQNEETFAPRENIQVVSEPLSLQEIVNIWDAFKPNLQISVAYVARMVLLDSTVSMYDAPAIQTRTFDFVVKEARI